MPSYSRLSRTYVHQRHKGRLQYPSHIRSVKWAYQIRMELKDDAVPTVLAQTRPQAFESAWTAACSRSFENPNVIVPSGRVFLVSPIKFEGPCKSSSITFEILGTIIAYPREAWEKNVDEWIYFHRVEGFYVVGNGQGVIDGQGDSWWGHAMRFSSCNKLQLNGLKHKDSQRNHISVDSCHNSRISSLHIIAAATSPNTDGIDISSSSNVNIHDCVIETGDDCIAINEGTSSLYNSRITCGPGHGISLGKDGSREEVEGILLNNCTFIRTQNGVRIKTWQGGSGFAKNITFSNINFESSNNHVIIDQYYCPHKKCDDYATAVEVSDVRYIRLHGTSARSNGLINLKCSRTVPCTGIVFDGLDIILMWIVFNLEFVPTHIGNYKL
ncbi:hypothetical protein C2S53_000681 [Perilla frutescens var. hirtella]|uniref:Polygalacturonase n=1 Tax=Perilla frutescens var. hirtella TaxID=608512 RepID=A0AAD4J016_PERFH|nr:hypothetical protein C2S53_000681 [Perilla frutescens var. hirtella]